jgi:hypothetical protein
LAQDFSGTRRQLFQSCLAAGAAAAVSPKLLWANPPRRKLPVAAVVTRYRKGLHADVLVTKILEGWRHDGREGPNLQLVALYADQLDDSDPVHDLARKHGFPIVPTIDEALTLGTDRLAVEGVLSIGEHGDYPYTPDTKQHMYPRRRFFDEIVTTMQRTGQFVPLFNDKHIGYRWSDATAMVDTAKRLGIPFMAGSSLPVAWRYPRASLPLESDIEEVLCVGYGGLENYGFHALETLQCLAERRRGGETGVKSVTVATTGMPTDSLQKQVKEQTSTFYLVEYRDGLRGTVAMLNGIASEFAVACQLREKQDPFACWFRLECPPHGHFEYLLRAIEHMFHTGQPAYPVERTLLTTGILDRVMHSVYQGGITLKTPELDLCYQPADWPFANREVENYPGEENHPGG